MVKDETKKYNWTIDLEFDWGGRVETTKGLDEGLPQILQLFDIHNTKALFFVSTELIRDNRQSIDLIKEKGHEIGSHGHFHIKYSSFMRGLQDKEISEALLQPYLSNHHMHYRAPWFSRLRSYGFYSHPKDHISMLKSAWFGCKPTNSSIFYLHPFDIIKGYNPPNLFCSILYSRPDIVFRTFERLLRTYPGTRRLK